MKQVIYPYSTSEEGIEEIVAFVGNWSVGNRFGMAEEVRADYHESYIPGEESFLKWPKLFAGEQVEICATSFYKRLEKEERRLL